MMRDNRDDQLDRLFLAARMEAVDRVVADDYFETRLMSRIREQREIVEPWYAAAWRFLPAFAVVAAMITVCTFTLNTSKSSDMFAAITSGQDETVGISYLTGE
jgi:hypothetical protein